MLQKHVQACAGESLTSEACLVATQDLHLTHHELVEIGDTVSICRLVRPSPATLKHSGWRFPMRLSHIWSGVDPRLCAALCALPPCACVYPCPAVL
jgi:hypothetical protein